MKRMVAIGAVGVTAVFLAGTAFMVLRAPDDVYAECRASQVAGGDIGGPFELVNGAGETVTDAEVITEPALLYFGYTSCPDVCPLDVDRNAAATEILDERGQTITPVFITVDPARDTPEVVGDFAEVMHPRMVGLTGSPEQVKAASQAYRTYYKAHPADENGEYLVDHSTFSYLVMPEEGVVDFFRREMRPEEMADRIGCFLEKR